MKYYLIEISAGDARIAGKAIYEYQTMNEAVASFHSKIGTAMKSDLYKSELVIVIDDKGNVCETNCYENENYLE